VLIFVCLYLIFVKVPLSFDEFQARLLGGVPPDDIIKYFVRNGDASQFSREAIYVNKLQMSGLSYYYRIILINGCLRRLKYNEVYGVTPLQSLIR
jgi:hypothetical protein